MIPLSSHNSKAPESQSLRVKVKPQASANAVGGWADETKGVLLIKVTAPAEGGKANAAVIALLAKELGISKSAITVRAGHTSRYKLLSLVIAPERLAAWLEQQ